jgi:hypothetical protein
MAKNTKPAVQEEEDIDIDLGDLDIEGVEVEETEAEEEAEETDVIEEELEEAAKVPVKKEKKAKGEALASTRALAEDEVGAGYIADQCGVDSREIRAYLRKNYRNMENDKSKRYAWKKGDPQVQEIIDHFKSAKSGKKTEPQKEVKAAAPAAKPTPVAKTPAPAATKVATPPVKAAAPASKTAPTGKTLKR